MNPRKESEIFSDLAKICTSPGYIHAIAYFCFRDNTIKYRERITTNEVLQQFTPNRLIRTEISTIIGLACTKKLNTELPAIKTFENYLQRTEELLEELHHSMMPAMADILKQGVIKDEDFNPFRHGTFLREPIFYSGEGAYHFQYREFSKLKYIKDDSWFINNKGYSIEQAIEVIHAIHKLQNNKLNNVLSNIKVLKPQKRTFLPGFIFSIEEIKNVLECKVEIITNVIKSFTLRKEITNFLNLDDYNPINAYPIIKLSNDNYLLFQNYSLMQALYETPFFWLHSDEKYRQTAMQHRGEFTEGFSTERLKLVFGEKNVFTNIEIYSSIKDPAGEIDVLVIFANRAIVIQAKSKKLTIAARKGNDNSLRSDFKKAVQEAYDQAYLCSTFLNDINYKFIDKSGLELKVNRNFKEIYPICIVSEQYPALSFQARQFLDFKETNTIMPPFVMDVFLLDVMTELLQSPLYFLSYINRRTSYGNKIHSTHELTILAYHLKKNLWMDDEYSMMYFEDDIGAGLDLAMLSRRDGVPGLDTPDGILTLYKGSYFDNIITDINKLEHPTIVDLGFLLLSLSGETIDSINKGINYIKKQTREDGLNHDITLAFGSMQSGLTIHCNNDNLSKSTARLDNHCRQRKYKQKAKSWFGICIGTLFPNIRFGTKLEYKWEQSAELDNLVKYLPNYHASNSKPNFIKHKKIKRNEKCLCGSGKKYKNCCLE